MSDQDATQVDSSSDPSQDIVARRKHVLEKGHVRAQLIRDLAMGDKTAGQLAEIYGVSRSSVSMFKGRHMTEIEQVSANLADQYADLWIASKRSRLAELQVAAEKLAEKPDARSAEVLAKLLKDAAEELGDLPVRPGVQINQANVTYQIEGVDLEALK